MRIPGEVNTIGGLLTSADGDPVVVIVVCCHGSLEAAEKRLRAIRFYAGES
jgi:hypothetical protein